MTNVELIAHRALGLMTWLGTVAILSYAIYGI
jgi:hypothetical protein